jgi:hypothetical protein
MRVCKNCFLSNNSSSDTTVLLRQASVDSTSLTSPLPQSKTVFDFGARTFLETRGESSDDLLRTQNNDFPASSETIKNSNVTSPKVLRRRPSVQLSGALKLQEMGAMMMLATDETPLLEQHQVEECTIRNRIR